MPIEIKYWDNGLGVIFIGRWIDWPQDRWEKRIS